MQLIIDGNKVTGATGGRPHEMGRPLAIFVHGAGLDHTVWASQSRWLAFHGWNVLAVDLPGHGRSGGQPLRSIRAIAEWLTGVIRATDHPRAVLLGHSMGSLAALETAAWFPEFVTRLVLAASAAAMPVHPDMLAAAAANEHAAIDMVNLWGHGFRAGLGGCRTPGMWMVGSAGRTLEKARPGVLHTDLTACAQYLDGLKAAARVTAPTIVIAGERDQMTPIRSGRALAATIPEARLISIADAGHMLMAERPYEVQSAIAAHLGIEGRPETAALRSS